MEPGIRTLTLQEVETLVDWAADEGWNPGLSDPSSFYAADPDGFLGGFLNNELVTGISAVKYAPDFGFVGLFITRPDLRSLGYGRAIWSAAMDRLGGCTIGLDGVPEQQDNYRSKGFAYKHGTTRYSGIILDGQIHQAGIQVVTPELHQQIQAFDRLHFPSERQRFVQKWIDNGSHALVHVQDEKIRGFGVARKCRDGYKIGPLFAGNVEIATSILLSLGATCGSTAHIDVPNHQTEFASNLMTIGMSPGFTTARMYRGIAPAYQENGVYGVTSLELG